MDVVNRITDYWTSEILQGQSAVPLSRLNNTPIPENLRDELFKNAQRAIRDEVERICANPNLNTEPGEDGISLRDQLLSILSKRLIMSAELLREFTARAYGDIIDQWRVEPISFRQAQEDPDSLAGEIFRRAGFIAMGTGEDDAYSADVLSIVCNASGLKTVGDALRAEKELEAGDLSLEGFTIMTRRLMLLKQRYSLGRRLISHEGEGRTLTGVSAPKPAKAPAPKAAAPTAPAPEPAVEESAPVAEAAPAAVVAKTSAPSVSAPVQPPRSGLDEAGSKLYNALMKDENLSYFSAVLFDKDTVAFQRLVYQLSRQTRLENALILADNELFVCEIPSHATPAVKLLGLIREHFQ